MLTTDKCKEKEIKFENKKTISTKEDTIYLLRIYFLQF